ncbi:MAG: hypothetical protein GY714_00280 [Desulfobacterales bacterium]|nr:hypothetical protein [Desulfobacterales bacterium]MCP4159139.1 hypothetical protein [Deltaproteobacteria bacterium]
MGLFRKIFVLVILFPVVVFAEPIVLYDFEIGAYTSFMKSSDIAVGQWDGGVSESSFGLLMQGKMKQNISNIEYDISFNRFEFNWKNSSGLSASNGQDPFKELDSINLNSEYNKEFNKDLTIFTILNCGLFYESDMGGTTALLAAGIYNTYYLNKNLKVKIGGGVFYNQTPSEESYMPLESKSGENGYGILPYFKVIWNENTTGKLQTGASGYLEYGKGMVAKANLSIVYSKLFSMDYFFISNRGEYQLDDDNPIANDGFVIKEEMDFGIRTNFTIQPNLFLIGEVNYLMERKWKVYNSNSNETYTLKPDAGFGVLVKFAYRF